MGREVNQPQHWLKYVEKFWDVYFSEFLYSCCRSNLGIAQTQSRMAAHKFTQPLPVCSSLFYWQWTGKTIFMASSKANRLMLPVIIPKNFAPLSDSNWQVLLRYCTAKLVSDQVGYWSVSFISVSLLLTLFLSVDLGTSNTFDFF
jgi:hypothetical protein